jgi:hypothetical protein
MPGPEAGRHASKGRIDMGATAAAIVVLGISVMVYAVALAVGVVTAVASSVESASLPSHFTKTLDARTVQGVEGRAIGPMPDGGAH